MKYCGKEQWNHVEGWACVLEAGHAGQCREACQKEFVGGYICWLPKGHENNCEGDRPSTPEIVALDPTIRRHIFNDRLSRRLILGTNHPLLKEPLTLANPAPTRT